ncbi:Signal transduction histidine-protein kinase ArlS [Lentilactobacillus parabuchneri]|uniref:histidine kinase n=2 Tax=Lentilactobacillus TaxID=2767893 RepID=A0A1X1FHP3_9LACO|nr:HAMP domain-containing sensor histidine kinase [Lentilactobacillus parabuchneri]APR06489.1 Signal transduction histidine-protein kinase ArlS [Lentilactobacillus parabuchneri]MBW0223642.1 HAMP domain-containing histidine kinase [Lentilactobacillus parabuchneri]MBW0246386.1 HAMP domain-containing histidine kinase [Lentilactobacillus parabuchneri]MBW0264342.1 HAMP domain-containing histidine kinase [Lentilactobacillus parabuchneri]MCT2885376.1 sensor histidine kinase [Lentilactobacillus parabu
MKKRDPQTKQQLSLFVKELIGFALLFAVLGIVINFFFHQSIYKNIDQGLMTQKQNVLSNRKAPQFRTGGSSSSSQTPPSPNPSGDTPFRTNILVFNQKGQIINAQMLGNRIYNLFINTELDKSEVNKVREVTLMSTDNTLHYFRTLLIKVPKSNSNPIYAGNYVLILENIDTDLLAVNSFRRSLLITLLFFWIIAIGVAYYLSRSSMKPIMDAWKRQRQFSANAAHELRTPLTVIQNQMEYMLTKPKTKVVDQVDAISTTLDEVRHLQTLTNRLLMLARSDAGKIEIRKQEVDVKPWFEHVLKPYDDIAASQHKSLNTVLKADGKGRFDEDLIRQLLIILLDNAIKYTPKGGTVTVVTLLNRDKLTIEVRDTGTGIPDADKKRVFDRFYRSDKSRNSKTGGNGLGLAIAKWIVNQHAGTITVKDNHPKGTVFTVGFKVS